MVDAIVADACARLTYSEASRRLGALEIAYGRLRSLADAATHPHMRTMVVETQNGEVRVIAPAAILSDDAANVVRKVPARGQHTRAIEEEFGLAVR